MSAVVAHLNHSDLPGRTASMVEKGLDVQTGRAPGPIELLSATGAALGFRAHRASGVDHAGAAQRHTTNGDVFLVLSGFIDNLTEMQGKVGDHQPSPAETLLENYLSRGEGFIDHVGGAFAIAIWDERTRTGYLYRDRLGVEPLYYFVDTARGEIRASSELKGLFVDPKLPRRFDITAVPDLLNSTSRVPGTTVYRDYWEVKPGTALIIHKDRIAHRTYWEPPRRTTVPDLAEASETIRSLLHDATRRRMNQGSDATNQGFLLSGGLDSSLICSFASRNAGSSIDTYSFTYEDAAADFKADALHVSLDEPFVKTMAQALGSRHTDITVPNEQFEEALKKTVKARDLPGVGDLDVALMRMLEAVATDKNVVFSGEAADDLFGGYPWFSGEYQRRGNTFPWLSGSAASSLLRDSIRRELDIDATLRSRYEAACTEARTTQGRSDGEARMRGVFWAELTRFLPFLLDRVDRMSAAAGVRVQLPFTDHRLVEYVWDLPYAMKTTGNIEKGILRKAGEGWLPTDIRTRRKSGFAVGKSPAYREAIQTALEHLTTRQSVVWDIADRDAVRNAVQSGAWADGTYSGPPILPRLVMLDIWSTEYNVSFV
jgi:asparagine synthase (glutamine-hydrolyzing)